MANDPSISRTARPTTKRKLPTDFFDSIGCWRCGKADGAFTMSRFNTDRICMNCQDLEKAHPKYQEAVNAELIQVQQGNYNYEGIGKPKDL